MYSASSRPAMASVRPLVTVRAEERLDQIDGQREDHDLRLLMSNVGERLQVAQLQGGRLLGERRGGLDQLLRRLRPRLKQVLGRYRVPAHDAEDLVQEALIATIQKWDEIQDHEAWILVTLRNRCVVYWRKRRASLYQAVDNVILELLSEPIAAPQERAELLWDLNHLLEDLPQRCRTLLRLRYSLGYDPSEVAERMGYHPSSVRKVARRCMAALTYQMVARGFSKEDAEELVEEQIKRNA
jgi:RNA polymerase sigma-70 factor (ECF subfamily)